MSIGDKDFLVDIFESRKLEVDATRAKWFRWFVVNIIILFALGVIIFLGLVYGASYAVASWLEFAVALPLVYSAIFFHAQHAKARDYLEEYSFKLLSVRALSAFREILGEEVDLKSAEERKKRLSFVIGAMEDISVPPRQIISKHPLKDTEDVKVGVVEKLGDVFKKFISLGN